MLAGCTASKGACSHAAGIPVFCSVSPLIPRLVSPPMSEAHAKQSQSQSQAESQAQSQSHSPSASSSADSSIPSSSNSAAAVLPLHTLFASSDAEFDAHLAAWPLHIPIPFADFAAPGEHEYRSHTLLTYACKAVQPEHVALIIAAAARRERQLRESGAEHGAAASPSCLPARVLLSPVMTTQYGKAPLPDLIRIGVHHAQAYATRQQHSIGHTTHTDTESEQINSGHMDMDMSSLVCICELLMHVLCCVI